jgi:endonuclease/exonuclease/phosphatase family metal-dependent hydrolase
MGQRVTGDPPRERTGFRIASYNVHRCVGTDRRRDVERVAAVIGEIDADVIGLQEIDCGYFHSHPIDQMEQLQQATGMKCVMGPTQKRDAYVYGNALFTRRSILAVRHADLSVRRREPRAALDVDVEIDGRLVRVIVTHFGLSPRERRQQTSTLLETLSDQQRDLTVLCGDFNEWTPPWPTVRELDAYFGPSRPLRSFPARRPLLALDRIWIRPATALAALWIHRSQLARVASDHLPICADIFPPAE